MAPSNFNRTVLLKLLLVGSIVGPLSILLVVARQDWTASLRGAETRAFHLASITVEHARHSFDALALGLQLVNERVQGRSGHDIATSKQLWESVKATKDSLVQADSIFIINDAGVNVLTTRAYPSPPTDFSDRDYFVAQRQKPHVFISERYAGRISGDPIFNMSVARSNADGTFAGVIGSSASVGYFENFFGTVAGPWKAFSIELFRDGGGSLARFPGSSERRAAMDRTHEAPPMTQGENDASQIDAVAEGRARVGAYPVEIRYWVARAAFVQEWRQRMLVWIVITALVSGGLFAVSWLALQRANAERRALSRLQHEARERERAESRLRQTQKLEALGQLTGGIAHDFNNVLQVIIAGANRLATKALDAKHARITEMIVQAAEDGAVLTRQLLTFSRRQQISPEPTDPRQQILRAKPMLDQSLRGDIQAHLLFGDGLWTVEVDHVEFEMALINIVANARDAMPTGGRLTVDVRNVSLSGDETPDERTGDHVAISITDTGEGMPPEVIEHAFEPFYTTKDPGIGTGLGLSQVYGFVAQAGGSVALRSEPGQGTNVTMYLPRSFKSPTAMRRRKEGDGPLPEQKQVLMVEDNPDVAEAGRDILASVGFSVTVVRDGESALQSLADGTYDALFADIVMPGMSGIDLADTVRTTYPGLPILLTTGYNRYHGSAKTSDYRVLRKPYHPNELRQALRSVIEEHAHAQEPSVHEHRLP